MNEDGNQVEDFIAYCDFCGFWFGIGTRADNGPVMHRTVHGRICKFDINAEEVTTADLVRYLERNHNRIGALDPFRAEGFVADLLREVLGWDVERAGGVRDRGVDGYILRNGERRGLIQIKWHRSSTAAMSVKVVREVIGTIIARGLPSGVIISTSPCLSRDAAREIQEAASSILLVEPMQMEYLGYRDLIAMLELAKASLGAFSGPPQQAIDIILESREAGWLTNTFFDRWEEKVL